MKVKQGKGIIASIDKAITKTDKEYLKVRVVNQLLYCWPDTTGLFKQIELLKVGDEVIYFAEEDDRGFINCKSIFRGVKNENE